MNSDPITFIKASMAVNLEKQGSSVEELEKALSENNYDKTAELMKKAFIDPKDLGSTPMLYSGGIAGGSYVGGKALDRLDEAVDQNESELNKYKTKINYLKKLTERINRENA